MSTYPLDEPQLEALRSVCVLAIAAGNPPGFLEGLSERADEPAKSAAYAISSPASTAALVRDLLERAGVETKRVWDHDMIRGGGAAWVMVDVDGAGAIQAVAMAHIPSLLLALCDLAPGDREGAMRVLKEVGR